MTPLEITKTPDTAAKHFTIVVGLDFTDAGGLAFDQAARIARGIPHANVELLHVFEGPHVDLPMSSRELIQRLKLYADEKAAAFGGLPGVTIGIHLRSGTVAREIVQFATDVSADLVVLGSHKAPHLRSWLVGSTAERMMSSSPCPVLVAAPTPVPAAKHEPAIEEACPACTTARFVSHGAEWWCASHAEHARRAHAYSYRREHAFATHDSVVSSTGVDS
jgi:nucleotide-binding universal stress UspA family protein